MVAIRLQLRGQIFERKFSNDPGMSGKNMSIVFAKVPDCDKEIADHFGAQSDRYSNTRVQPTRHRRVDRILIESVCRKNDGQLAIKGDILKIGRFQVLPARGLIFCHDFAYIGLEKVNLPVGIHNFQFETRTFSAIYQVEISGLIELKIETREDHWMKILEAWIVTHRPGILTVA